MIHAFLFLTAGDANREAHGPAFRSRMEAINASTNVADPYRPPGGYKVTVYHNFMDEVLSSRSLLGAFLR